MKNMIKEHIQVNAPFSMLYEDYLPLFMEHGINPEIGFDAHSLDTYTPSQFTAVAERLREKALSITLHGPFSDRDGHCSSSITIQCAGEVRLDSADPRR